MPSEDVWSHFFDVNQVLDRMRVNSRLMDAADFACGYGTFAIPAAQRIAGIMYAIDIDPQMTRMVADKARELNLVSVRVIVRDLLSEGSGLRDDSLDYVMLFNILHLDEPQVLLREAFRVLKQGAGVGIIHWIRDPNTPRGPPLEMRPTVGECQDWCRQAGFRGQVVRVELKPYHYGLVVGK
jgi:ubiquinone/menaquinone biosynthesis C-methylase UbiE